MSILGPDDQPGQAQAMLAAVERRLVEEYGPHELWNVTTFPPGLRLEVHPTAFYAFFRDVYTIGWVASMGSLSAAFRVPAIVSPSLPERGWRLVVVTENVLLGGTI